MQALSSPQKVDLYLHKFLNLISLNPLAPIFWLFLSKISHFLPSIPFSKTIATLTFLLGLKRFLVRKVNWNEQVVLVTGGASGIGKELTKMLGEKGVKVIVIDILKSDSPYHYQCDLSKAEDVARVCEEISKKFKITMLVNNAGIVNAKLFQDLTLDQMTKCMQINILAHFQLIKHFLPDLINCHGHILATGSIMGLTSAACATDYCASKYAVTGFMESLRQEVGDKVYVSTIFPGLVQTGMFDGVKHSMEYLTPPLETVRVAKEMMGILEKKSSQELVLPVYGRLTPLLKLLPLEVNDLVHYLTGANEDLKGFKGSLSAKLK